jgi:hypothetical protein
MDGSDDIIPSESLSYQPPVKSSVDDIIPHESLTASSSKSTPSYDTSAADQADLEADPSFGEGVLHAASGGLSSLVSGFRYAMGADKALSQEQIDKNRNSLVYEPRTEGGKQAAAAFDKASSYTGQKEGEYLGPRAADWAAGAGAPPWLAGGVGAGAETLANVPQLFIPGAIERGAGALARVPARLPMSRPGSGRMGPIDVEATPAGEQKLLPAPEQPPLTAAGAERPAYFDINDPKAGSDLGLKPEKQEAQEKPNGGALPDAQQEARKALAKRVGLKEVRTSAITGDGQAAADDFDSTKYTNDPTGERMRTVMKMSARLWLTMPRGS